MLLFDQVSHVANPPYAIAFSTAMAICTDIWASRSSSCEGNASGPTLAMSSVPSVAVARHQRRAAERLQGGRQQRRLVPGKAVEIFFTEHASNRSVRIGDAAADPSSVRTISGSKTSGGIGGTSGPGASAARSRCRTARRLPSRDERPVAATPIAPAAARRPSRETRRLLTSSISRRRSRSSRSSCWSRSISSMPGCWCVVMENEAPRLTLMPKCRKRLRHLPI